MARQTTMGRPAERAGLFDRLAGPLAGAVAFMLTLAALFAWDHRPAPATVAPPFEEVAVTLADGTRLSVGRYEITYALWRQCHEEGGCAFLPKPGRKDADGQFPVTDINRLDIDQFIGWINRRSGLGYRLPSLAEWRDFAGIPENENRRKLFDDPRLEWAADYGSGRPRSHKVRPSGHFGLAPSGVADIDGNVWEWTASCVASSTEPARCPADYAGGIDHIAEIPVFLRDAYGGGCSAGVPPANLGFRLVRD